MNAIQGFGEHIDTIDVTLSWSMYKDSCIRLALTASIAKKTYLGRFKQHSISINDILPGTVVMKSTPSNMIGLRDSVISDHEFYDRYMLSQICLSQFDNAMFQEIEEVHPMPPRYGSTAALHSPVQVSDDHIPDILTAVAELRTLPEGRKVKLFNQQSLLVDERRRCSNNWVHCTFSRPIGCNQYFIDLHFCIEGRRLHLAKSQASI
jgi:hypothetical protein